MSKKCYVLILASGEGKRFEGDLPKQFSKIREKTLFEYSLERFENNGSVNEIILVINPKYSQIVEEAKLRDKYKKLVNVIDGGKTRMESSYRGIKSLNASDSDIVLIHDAVRPLISDKLITACCNKLEDVNAVITALPVSDTIYSLNEQNNISNLVDRKKLLKAQTPQGFNVQLIKQAYELAIKANKLEFTDDAGLILYFKLDDLYWVSGDEKNIKITYPIDEKFARIIIDNSDL